MRLIDYFDRGADLYPDRHCLHDGTQGWTYREVRAQTHRVANGLLAAGLGRGAKAAVYSANQPFCHPERREGSHGDCERCAGLDAMRSFATLRTTEMPAINSGR